MDKSHNRPHASVHACCNLCSISGGIVETFFCNTEFWAQGKDNTHNMYTMNHKGSRPNFELSKPYFGLAIGKLNTETISSQIDVALQSFEHHREMSKFFYLLAPTKLVSLFDSGHKTFFYLNM